MLLFKVGKLPPGVSRASCDGAVISEDITQRIDCDGFHLEMLRSRNAAGCPGNGVVFRLYCLLKLTKVTKDALDY